MKDESHLPVAEQSLVFRLAKRAEIRRQIPGRKSVEEGASDRIADLLEEAAMYIMHLEQRVGHLEQRVSNADWQLNPDRTGGAYTEDEINPNRGWK